MAGQSIFISRRFVAHLVYPIAIHVIDERGFGGGP
jgi:hypothetical protein